MAASFTCTAGIHLAKGEFRGDDSHVRERRGREGLIFVKVPLRGLVLRRVDRPYFFQCGGTVRSKNGSASIRFFHARIAGVNMPVGVEIGNPQLPARS